MCEADHFRYRIEYAKTCAMRFTGHLDVLRAWERTFRRAKLPLAFTHGFNPHPRINLSAPLPLGFTSECELMDLWLKADIHPNTLKKRIKEASPPGLQVKKGSKIPTHYPTLQKLVRSAEYHIQLNPVPPPELVQLKIDGLLSSLEIIRLRRGKSYDLRPLIESLDMISDDGNVKILMRLAAKEGATGRPEEVLRVLDIDPATARVHRMSLILGKNHLLS